MYISFSHLKGKKIFSCSLLHGTNRLILFWSCHERHPHTSSSIKDQSCECGPFFRVTHTHRHSQLSFVVYLQSRVKGNESAAAKEGLHASTQPNPYIQTGRYRTVTKSFLGILKLFATLIGAVPLLRSRTEEVKINLSLPWTD